MERWEGGDREGFIEEIRKTCRKKERILKRKQNSFMKGGKKQKEKKEGKKNPAMLRGWRKEMTSPALVSGTFW